jgi:hypothetical protein
LMSPATADVDIDNASAAPTPAVMTFTALMAGLNVCNVWVCNVCLQKVMWQKN